MKLNLKKYFFLLLFNLLLFSSYGQEHLVEWRENAPLTWDDFRGTPEAGNPYGATANTGISFGYNYARVGDKVDLTFEVNCYFDKNNSWSQKAKQSPELLKHEQLHFDLAELHARLLRKTFASATFTTNYKAEIKRIYETHMKALHEMQHRYDLESDHSMNRENQAKWEAYVRAELEKTKQDESHFPAVGNKTARGAK
jgi:hypothetical protein